MSSVDSSVDHVDTNGDKPPWKSKKFIAYMVTVPLLIFFLLAQIYVDYQLALLEKEPLFTEDFMTLQLYIIGALVIVYIGGQAALDAVLGWIRGSNGKPPPQPPQVVVVGQPSGAPLLREVDEETDSGVDDPRVKMRPRSPEELGLVKST